MTISNWTWDARIQISELEMCNPIIVRKRKPYIKTIRQERDPTIKNYVVVERQCLPAYFVVITPPGEHPPESREITGPTIR
jgi:hypothetical protein